MSDTFAALAVLSQSLRAALLVGGGVLAVVAALDWAVRTRRVNPFGWIARFMRARVDPRLAGVERQVLRMGGQPGNTPWWALLAYVVLALLVLAVWSALLDAALTLSTAVSYGPLGILSLLVGWTFALLRFAIIVRAVSSFLPSLRYRPWISWSYPATEWMLRPLRRVIPTLGVIDITPLVAYIALELAQSLVQTVLLAGTR